MTHPVKFFFIAMCYTGPLTILGIALCATIIGIPLGMAVLALASKPLADMLRQGILDTTETTQYDKFGNPIDPDLIDEPVYETEQEVEKPWRIN